MQNIHFVLMKSAVQEILKMEKNNMIVSLKGEIVFSSDPSTWKQENPIWVADYRARLGGNSIRTSGTRSS
jgi:hypothetical protein